MVGSVYLYHHSNKKLNDVNTVTFSMPVELKTGHPEYSPTALWLGRAEITQEVDYDDNDNEFIIDVAHITDLWFLPNTACSPKLAQRVELPVKSRDAWMFRYNLEQAAISAYHKPELQPAEMPDDEK